MAPHTEGEKYLRAIQAAQILAESFPQIDWIKLFGSVARGTEREKSDIDLMVVYDSSTLEPDNGKFVTPEMVLVHNMVKLVVDQGLSRTEDDPRGPIHLCA